MSKLPITEAFKEWARTASEGEKRVFGDALQYQKDQGALRDAEKKAQQEAKKAVRNARRVQARLEAKKLRYVKQDDLVRQKNLRAQWAFPVSRLEEFLGMFQNAVYNVAVDRMSGCRPIDKEMYGEENKAEAQKIVMEHPVDAMKLVSAIVSASNAQGGYQSNPDNCEVDYFFWVFKGWVFFGCVLPSSEKIEPWKLAKWVKTPYEVWIGRERQTSRCPDGTIPVYVRLLSFMPMKMVGVQEFAKRMVSNQKECEWAILYALRILGEKITKNRKDWVDFGQQKAKERSSGAGMIGRERVRQVEMEGFTAERDDSYVNGELAKAAMAYANPEIKSKTSCPSVWPKTWHKSGWKPSDDPVGNLIKAGALIAAEIDRIHRERSQGSIQQSPAKIMQDIIRHNLAGV